MDKKNNFKNFLKKEGFYVILFVCLCVVATVAAITIRNNKIAKTQPPIAQTKQVKENTPKVAEQPIDNALQVKKKNNAKNAIAKNAKNTAPVNKNLSISFLNPVNGTLARAYSEDPVYWSSTDSSRPNWGIDIKSNIGKPVVAVADGKVEAIKTDSDGVKVVVNHQNGLKTVYANLDKKVSVKKGESVKKGQQIGKVGRTTLNSAYETYGDHLHFEVLKSNSPIDPAKYVKYEHVK